MKIRIETLLIAFAAFPSLVELSSLPCMMDLDNPEYWADLYYKDDNCELQELPYTTELYLFNTMYIGWFSGDDLIPLFNDKGKPVFQEAEDDKHPTYLEEIDPAWLETIGIPGNTLGVLRNLCSIAQKIDEIKEKHEKPSRKDGAKERRDTNQERPSQRQRHD